jgi:hypothetical protein
VTAWSPVYGSLRPAAVQRALTPVAPPVPPVLLGGTSVTVDATVQGTPYLDLSLVDEVTGERRDVLVGPLRTGSVTAPLTGCAPHPCRLASIGLSGPAAPTTGYLPPDVGWGVLIHQIRTSIGVAASSATLGNVVAWRTRIANGDLGLRTAFSPAGLDLYAFTHAPPPTGLNSDYHVFPADAPSPLPAVEAGVSPTDLAISRIRYDSLAGEPVPMQVNASAPALPALGPAGLLVDLQSLNRIAIDPVQGDFQVWLAPGAPAALLSRLTGQGLVITGTDSIAADASRLAREGPAAALTFQLLTGVVGVLLAAVALVAAAASERRSRATELAYLRAQGLPARSATAIGYGGYGVLVAAAVGCGLLAAALARVLTRLEVPFFVDPWPVPGVSHAPSFGLLAAGLVAVLALFGGTAYAIGRSLAAATSPRAAS